MGFDVTSEVRENLEKVSSILRTAALQSSNLNDALRLMQLYARLHWDNISGFFADDALEQSLFERWLPSITMAQECQNTTVDFLHIATQVYHVGGHTRLLRHLMHGLSEYGSQALLLTDAKRNNALGGWDVDMLKVAGKPASRAGKIVDIGAKAETILLHTHPDDSAAAFAARILRESGKRVLFVNHADHVFSLGPGAADVVLEICMTGWRTTRDRRNARIQSFMGIPIAKTEEIDPIWEQNRKGPIVSMGSPGKFKPDDALNFPEFLTKLLPRVQNDVILIGPSPKDTWWTPIIQNFPERIKLMGPQPPEKVTEIMRSASCYVDSFPLDGGTAYPQAALMGVPCFGPNEGNAAGFSPADKLRFSTVEEMQEALISYLEGGPYPFDLNKTRERIAKDFASSAIAKRVILARDGISQKPFDHLKKSGQRSPDSNAHRWEKGGVLHLPKRQWRGLSFKARTDLIRKNFTSDLAKPLSRTLIFRILTNWI